MKKFFKNLLAIALVGVMVGNVACNKYDDDINGLTERLDKIEGTMALKTDVQALQSTVNALNGIDFNAFMKALNTDGKYTISEEMKAKLADFYGGFATEEDTADIIKRIYDACGYVIDTHTAVAAHVYEQYKSATGDNTKTVIASTASPYKFTRSVMAAIAPDKSDGEDFALVDALCELSKVSVPNAVEEIRTAEILHKTVCEVEDMCKEVKGFLRVN